MSTENLKKESDRWIRQAREDFSVAQLLCLKSKFAQSCFFSQQSAEKALKALWYQLDKDPWGHSACRLIEDIKKEPQHTVLMQLHEHAQTLDRFYIGTRYPNGLPELIPQEAYNERDAKNGLKASKKLIQAVEKELRILSRHS